MRKQLREVYLDELLAHMLLPPAILTAIWIIYGKIIINKVEFTSLVNILTLTAFIVISYYGLKYFAIGTVLCYKAFAPLSVRDNCRFNPTCSTYMILAIKKYGLFIGVFKGIKRILRCKPPNGGDDFP